MLFGGEHPGAKFRSDCIVRIDALLDSGFRQFVDLTGSLEGPGPYVLILHERAGSRELQVAPHRFAIPDFDVPTAGTMRAALDLIERKWSVTEKRMRRLCSPETPDEIAFIGRWRGT